MHHDWAGWHFGAFDLSVATRIDWKDPSPGSKYAQCRAPADKWAATTVDGLGRGGPGRESAHDIGQVLSRSHPMWGG